MNLIEQLQQTPKWKQFEQWYNNQDYSILLEREGNIGAVFIEMPFDFQKGVFEKFIESKASCSDEASIGKDI